MLRPQAQIRRVLQTLKRETTVPNDGHCDSSPPIGRSQLLYLVSCYTAISVAFVPVIMCLSCANVYTDKCIMSTRATERWSSTSSLPNFGTLSSLSTRY